MAIKKRAQDPPAFNMRSTSPVPSNVTASPSSSSNHSWEADFATHLPPATADAELSSSFRRALRRGSGTSLRSKSKRRASATTAPLQQQHDDQKHRSKSRGHRGSEYHSKSAGRTMRRSSRTSPPRERRTKAERSANTRRNSLRSSSSSITSMDISSNSTNSRGRSSMRSSSRAKRRSSNASQSTQRSSTSSSRRRASFKGTRRNEGSVRSESESNNQHHKLSHARSRSVGQRSRSSTDLTTPTWWFGSGFETALPERSRAVH